jgi:hypothetical protein
MDDQRKRSVCFALALAIRGEQDCNRTVGSDSAAGEPSGDQRFLREKGRVNNNQGRLGVKYLKVNSVIDRV